MEQFLYNVDESQAGMRIDKYLSELITDKSRSYIQEIINRGNVKVNDKIVKSNYKIKNADSILVDIPELEILSVEPEDIPLDIIYEDNDIIVVNKPQGMVVHPAVGNYSGTMVNALLAHCKDLSGINGVIRPGIVHRIDKDTSGVLVVAKNDCAHNSLSEQLKDHTMNRIYIALAEGVIKQDEGKVDALLGRHTVDRLKFAVVKDGKKAITHFKVLERYNNATLIQCKLETGRTHQIRVHMAHIGHPLVGDPLYGYKKQKFNLQGQMLHAKTLGFIHPTTHEYIEFNSELPGYFVKILNILKSELK
ncbi:RluA family pseudouridine synthase [Clostridium sp. 19966]|uniref:RluA family pseudouridine synthase n=1 Tax=Clostridium sp. 19966 TaxID=2768166 RepID=UPI0028DDA3AD|nr:RluA family pseudouridine synthase [Clostridium sp. 19966]MDT8716608.1 RluA family pseudouridine synthase [Clostridium sp. 19966]